jgi:hypothetical protein
LENNFIKENETERANRNQIQESYRKWIIRLRGEKIFNLHECDTFLAKFSNDIELESGIKSFSAFDNNVDKTLQKKNSTLSNLENFMKEDFWIDLDVRSNTDEGATFLRKDAVFGDKVVTALRNLVVDDKITDKKLVSFIVKIIFNVLTKGKFENQNIDITKNNNILSLAMTIFKVSQNDDSLHGLLNDTIKIIALFAKFYCYYSSGIDLSFSSGFLRYVPIILSNNSKPSNIHINLTKAVGIMLTAANMAPKRSLLFYKSLLDFNIQSVLFNAIKQYKSVSFI